VVLLPTNGINRLSATREPAKRVCRDEIGDAAVRRRYTVRRLPDGRLLVFLVDAMGSGLFASLSAMLAAPFSNHLVEHLHAGCGCDFTFSRFIERGEQAGSFAGEKVFFHDLRRHRSPDEAGQSDNIQVSIVIEDQRLYSLLDSLNLIDAFKVTMAGDATATAG
jgi:hypothetical protein